MAKKKKKSAKSPRSRTKPRALSKANRGASNEFAFNTSTKSSASVSRNRCLDTLRGLAIVLMIVDHAAGLWFGTLIEPFTIRFLTRLSMPLFCVISGYLLVLRQQTRAGTGDWRERFHWRRLTQVAGAALLANILYFQLYGGGQLENLRLEILASLLVCYLVSAIVGKGMVLALASWLLFPWDASIALFDYPITAVATCVAAGYVLGLFGRAAAVGTSVLIAGMLLTIRGALSTYYPVTEPTVYVLIFLPVAVGLVVGGLVFGGEGRAGFRIAGLEFAGRYPLTIYIAQYAVLYAIALAWA